ARRGAQRHVGELRVAGGIAERPRPAPGAAQATGASAGHPHAAQERHDPERLPAADRGRCPDLRGARRRSAPDLRARERAAAGAALLSVLIAASAMLTISQRLQESRAADARLVLPFELRSRSRFRAQLVGGEEVGVILARGQILRGGDLLLAADGRVIEVGAAEETVSTVHSAEPRALARAAYHLGNRHVALQIGAG